MPVNVSSYIVNAAEMDARLISPKDAAPRLLKTIADVIVSGKKASCAIEELASATGLPVPIMMDAIQLLQSSGMIEPAETGGFRLTPTGEKTHLLVAR